MAEPQLGKQNVVFPPVDLPSPFSIWRSSSLVLQLALQNGAFPLDYQNCPAKIGRKCEPWAQPAHLETPHPLKGLKTSYCLLHGGGGNCCSLKTKSSSKSERLSWGQSLEVLTLMVLFLWKPFRPTLVNEFQVTTQFLMIWSMQMDQVSPWFIFSFSFLKSNDPWSQGCQFKHTGDISLFITDVHFVPQKGRCNKLLGPGLALVSYFARQF